MIYVQYERYWGRVKYLIEIAINFYINERNPTETFVDRFLDMQFRDKFASIFAKIVFVNLILD